MSRRLQFGFYIFVAAFLVCTHAAAQPVCTDSCEEGTCIFDGILNLPLGGASLAIGLPDSPRKYPNCA